MDFFRPAIDCDCGNSEAQFDIAPRVIFVSPNQAALAVGLAGQDSLGERRALIGRMRLLTNQRNLEVSRIRAKNLREPAPGLPAANDYDPVAVGAAHHRSWRSTRSRSINLDSWPYRPQLVRSLSELVVMLQTQNQAAQSIRGLIRGA